MQERFGDLAQRDNAMVCGQICQMLLEKGRRQRIVSSVRIVVDAMIGKDRKSLAMTTEEISGLPSPDQILLQLAFPGLPSLDQFPIEPMFHRDIAGGEFINLLETYEEVHPLRCRISTRVGMCRPKE